jgi:lipoate-protein ligase B
MKSFKLFLEKKEESNIKISSIDRSGTITFLVNGQKYVYSVDSIIFNQKKFLQDMKYKPGKVFNWAIKNGTKVYP